MENVSRTLLVHVGQNAVKLNCMNKNSCKKIGPRRNNLSVGYSTTEEAVKALTTVDLERLVRAGSRCLKRLSNHPGLAKYSAGMTGADLCHTGIELLLCGRRRTKRKHLQTHEAFIWHLIGVIRSLASNLTRHAEPHVEHLTIQASSEDSNATGTDPESGQDIIREICDREWLDWMFNVLREAATPELRLELKRLGDLSRGGHDAAHIVANCSDHILSMLESEVVNNGFAGVEQSIS